MNKQKVLNLLGLAQRASKLTTGEELALKEIRNRKAKVVFIAADASQNTQKKIKDKCSFYQIPCFDTLTAAEIAHALGKPRMVVAVLDAGFAKKMQELLRT